MDIPRNIDKRPFGAGGETTSQQQATDKKYRNYSRKVINITSSHERLAEKLTS